MALGVGGGGTTEGTSALVGLRGWVVACQGSEIVEANAWWLSAPVVVASPRASRTGYRAETQRPSHPTTVAPNVKAVILVVNGRKIGSESIRAEMYILNKTKSGKSEVGTPGTPSYRCYYRHVWPRVHALLLEGSGSRTRAFGPTWGKLPPYRSIKNIGHQSGAGIEPDPELPYYPLSLVGLEPTDLRPTSVGLEPRTSQRMRKSACTLGQTCRQ